MRLVALLALSTALTACGLMAGLGDFADQPVGGGAASGGDETGGGGTTTAGGGNGGDGGSGGGGAGGAGGGLPICENPAPDWTQSFAAVWTFDADPLGTDATGNHHLDPSMVVGLPDTTQKMQGPASFELPAGEGLSHSDSSALGFSSTFTFGAWLRLEDGAGFSTSVPLTRFMSGSNGNPPAGYRILLGGAGRMNCHFNDDGANSTASHLLGAGVWHHVVCVVGSELSIWFDGELDDTTNIGATTGLAPDTPLLIPSTSQPFPGHIDEAFIVDESLSPEAIRRIRNCGIDGSRCCCRPGATSDYLSCGLSQDCDDLSPCDSATPPVL